MILNAANNGPIGRLFPHELKLFLLKRRTFPLELKVFVVKEYYWDNLPIAEVSAKLAWLSCTGTAHRSLPPKLDNLRVLELYYCSELVGLWKDGSEAPMYSRVLIISKCPKLQGIPKSIALLKNLKQLSGADAKIGDAATRRKEQSSC